MLAPREFFEASGGHFPMCLILWVNMVYCRDSEWEGNQIAEKDFGTTEKIESH